jgi:hypothetical protein
VVFCDLFIFCKVNAVYEANTLTWAWSLLAKWCTHCDEHSARYETWWYRVFCKLVQHLMDWSYKVLTELDTLLVYNCHFFFTFGCCIVLRIYPTGGPPRPPRGYFNILTFLYMGPLFYGELADLTILYLQFLYLHST